MRDNPANNPSLSQPDNASSAWRARRSLRPRQVGPAFWTVSSIISIIVNVILIVLVLLLGSQLFAIKNLVSDQLVGGLYNNFVLMDQAHIRTTIPVKTEVPAKFNLPLKTETNVRLTKDTIINGASVSLYGGVVTISNAPTNIVLPAGTILPVYLELDVPVDQKIPVELLVEVDIPLQDTELHKPFVGLQDVLGPYNALLHILPNSWGELVCGKTPGNLCNTLLP